MSSRLPRVSGIDVVAALRRSGFAIEYIKGSHFHLIDPSDNSRQTIVRVHPGKILKPKTLKSILDKTKLTPDELRNMF